MGSTYPRLDKAGDASNSATWAKAADWERHRARITELYRINTLAEVKRIMEKDFSIKAT